MKYAQAIHRCNERFGSGPTRCKISAWSVDFLANDDAEFPVSANHDCVCPSHLGEVPVFASSRRGRILFRSRLDQIINMNHELVRLRQADRLAADRRQAR